MGLEQCGGARYTQENGASEGGETMAEAFTGLIHPFAPVWNADSRVLVLGTFPSVQSRANDFYYGHPQNRFWKVAGEVYGQPAPQTVEQKRAFLLANGVALWDVLASCDIVGSADSAIRNPVANDLTPLLNGSRIRQIFTNGQTAARFYRLYCEPVTGLPATTLPSTSPANAAWSVQRLAKAWAMLRG